MKSIPCITILFALLLLISCSEKPQEQKVFEPASFVDPFICTGSDHGQTDVAAAIPFGMVKPCPDTDPIAHSGYDYNSKEILGFSHTRFSGVGCRGVGGNIRVLPYILKDSIPDKLAYNKESEKAIAGYYSVFLNNEIKVELTATEKVAFHKYTFPESENGGLSVDLTSSFAGHISEEHTISEDGMIMGKVNSVNVCRLGKYSFYYALLLDKKDKELVVDSSKVVFKFPTKANEQINLYCALSVISQEKAAESLKESMQRSFSQVKEDAYQKWNDLLGKVEIETDNDTLNRLFYTHLYHATQSPFMVSESNGDYRGSDSKLYNMGDKTYYHGWSIWDTFRSKLPLLSFFYPQKYTQMMASLRELYKQGKPDWATETEPFITIRTEHSIVVLLEAYKKGLLDFSLDEIYPFLQEEAENLPFKSPDNVLESSFDLWALSEIAGELGHSEDKEAYLAKAMEYKNIWKSKFLEMGENADIMHGDGLYEGTLWQYRWFVPFDIKGIQSMVGGRKKFEAQLDYFFDNELFNIGNQPDIQVPYLYAYTNSPWKAQRLVNTLLTKPVNNWYGTHKKWNSPIHGKIFKDKPEGYIKEMDDDAGTMSSWYIWSYIGLYPVFPGSTDMVINTPLSKRTCVKLPNGELEILAEGLTNEAIYIQKVYWNDKELDSCFIDFNELTKGGTLKIVLGDRPNINWGVVKN